ncbi:MAG: hypothetical protein FWH11_10615 [Micrococcales bacterium]|nr:hypothetical protein [Micrococcales bacterium]
MLVVDVELAEPQLVHGPAVVGAGCGVAVGGRGQDVDGLVDLGTFAGQVAVVGKFVFEGGQLSGQLGLLGLGDV